MLSDRWGGLRVALVLAIGLALAGPAAAANAAGASDAAADADAEVEADADITADAELDVFKLPEIDLDPALADSSWDARRVFSTAGLWTYELGADVVSDTWLLVESPRRWRAKEWLSVGAVAGITTGLIFLADEDIRRSAQKSGAFRDFGDGVRWMGDGPGLAALTGGFAAAGFLFDRPRERETARLLLEASAVGYLFNTAGKVAFGRSRPRDNLGSRNFSAFGGGRSFPSGETTSAFIMAGVVTSQYPDWPVQLVAYSLATAVGAGRIAGDAHWASDIAVSAALGIAISKTVAYFARKRTEARRKRRSGREVDTLAGHSFTFTPYGVRYGYRW